MGGNSFDFIVQGLQRQQQIMEELAAENKELRQQLEDLRAGHGIFVEIGNTRVALHTLLGEAAPIPPTERVAPTSQSIASEATSPIAEVSTAAIVELPSQTTTTPERISPPLPAARQQEFSPAASRTPSKFLEEMMIDEFSSAMTNPLATQTKQASKQETTEEEKKAALRRELMGSFLLE